MTDILPSAGSPAAGKRPPPAEYLLWCAARMLEEAHLEYIPADKYVRARNAAMEAAAAVISAHGTDPWACESDVWEALASAEPELAQRAGLFAAAARQREAAGTGQPHAVSATEASLMLVEAEFFVEMARLAAGVR